MDSVKFTHVDQTGKMAGMVNITEKHATHRMARAQGSVVLTKEIMEQLQGDELMTKKGPVFHTAVIAGIMAAKKTHELIPMCHPISLDHCDIQTEVTSPDRVKLTATVRVNEKTGVEMEALTAVSVAALTIYDMCKALSHDIRIESIHLLEKTGGKQDFRRE